MQRTVCTFKQYYGCHTQKECRLYPICSQLPKKQFIKNNHNFKIYRKINSVPLTESQRKEHQRKYDYYNYLFGNRKEYTNSYYQNNKEIILQKKKIDKPSQKIYEVQKGYCDEDCANCKYQDCILPLWNDTTEYMRLYKKNHKKQISQINKKSYEKNKNKKLAKQKEHRAKPEVKKARAEYDKIYRETHREQERAKQKRYYEKHKDEINAKKRAKRQQEKLAKENNKQ